MPAAGTPCPLEFDTVCPAGRTGTPIRAGRQAGPAGRPDRLGFWSLEEAAEDLVLLDPLRLALELQLRTEI